MKLNFIRNYGQRVICYMILSALVTLAVEGILIYVMGGMEHYFRMSGYRSIMFGPDGMRPEYRVMIMVGLGILTFVFCFYFWMRDTISYINEIIQKVRDISEGDFDNPIEVRGNDEFASMAQNLNQMQKNIKDIMERERVAEHTKNDLVSSVAHDIRTPLTSILGYLGWVHEKKNLDNETRDKYIEIVFTKAKRLEQLTNELFGFVKLEHNELKIHTSLLDLIQLMKQMLDEMTPSFVKYEIEFKFIHSQQTVWIEADGELMARLFENLLNNAVKYGKEGKQILIKMEQTSDWVVTKVVNYGHVIPKDELDAIFRKFYRAERSRSRNTGGTGLGLAIVQQIAQLHHGDIRVKSDLQGTVFEVDLPLHQPKRKEGTQG